ncbi:MAG: lipopolysaccharide transport periplasmic protein LptA [Halioglobus sp.]|nr:lipopolysaccharide transport periplasmic protein LptA [Halioglobus sp.]
MPHRGYDNYARALTPYLWLLILLANFQAVVTHALPDDGDQPIYLTADKAMRDEKKGVTIYTGNVQMQQGSIELEADTLTIYHTSDDPSEIVAEGKPARMRQQPELDKGVVHAHADIIKYFKNEDRVHLQTNAHIEQDGSVVDGDSIDYLMEKQLITAQSDQTRAGNKVVVVIPPSLRDTEDNKIQQERTSATENLEESNSGRITSE